MNVDNSYIDLGMLQLFKIHQDCSKTRGEVYHYHTCLVTLNDGTQKQYNYLHVQSKK